MSARAIHVDAGQTVRIIDTEGGQPGDLVAFGADDLSVRFSQARTRVENQKTAIAKGDRLWTNTFPPEVMFRVTADSFGAHDLLYAPCCRYALAKRFGVERDGCLENLTKALRPWNIEPNQIPDPLNLYFRVAVDEAGGMTILEPHSKAGSLIELRAEMNCIVAIATCSVPLNGKRNSGYQVKIVNP